MELKPIHILSKYALFFSHDPLFTATCKMSVPAGCSWMTTAVMQLGLSLTLDKNAQASASERSFSNDIAYLYELFPIGDGVFFVGGSGISCSIFSSDIFSAQAMCAELFIATDEEK